MAEAAYKQMIISFIRQTRPQSFRSGKSYRYPQRSLSTHVPDGSHIKSDAPSTVSQWQEHRVGAGTVSTDRPRIAALRDESEPRSFSSFLTDNYSRQHNYLRISVTEKCNLRCLYCMPEEGVQLSPPEHNLTTPEIVYLSELFVKQGVDKIRLTGGEPTVRKDIVSLMQQIGQLRTLGLKELCITTNGISLHRKLDSMVEAGLTGVNLSLDTLDPFQFTLMTRRNGHEAVMKSISRILEMNKAGAGIRLKINCVVMKGLNEREIVPFVELGRDKDVEVRFIEYMPFDGNKWSENKMLSFKEMLALIRVKYPDVYRMQDHANDTSKTYKVPGFVGRIGFITSMTHNFCGTCNRLRITSDGNLKVCLFGNSEVSLRDILRESNTGKPFDTEAMEAMKQFESDRRESLVGSTGAIGLSEREASLLDIIGLAVKRKKEKHAGMGELKNMKNRPMILIDNLQKHSPAVSFTTHTTKPLFEPRRSGSLHSATQNTIPLHILPHPRHAFGVHQFRNQSTFLGRRTYQSQRLVRYYIGPAVARQYNYDRSQFPKRIKSTRMRMLKAYLRDRLIDCHRAFATTHPFALDDYDDDHRPKRAAGNPNFYRPKLELTHLDNTGAAHMVEITGKAETKRVAIAVATLLFSNDRTYDALCAQKVVKGNAEAVSRLAAIQAAKKTSDLVPLAHPSLGITAVSVEIDVFGPNDRVYIQKCYKEDLQATELWSANGGVTITSTVKCEGKTGVEMEAITASTIGAVTMYDMLKAIDKDMVITGARVIQKEGGKSGGWVWDEKKNVRVQLSITSQENQQGRDPEKQKLDPSADVSNGYEGNEPPTSISDIDEWNQGLVAEFTTETTSGDSPSVHHHKHVHRGGPKQAESQSKQSQNETTTSTKVVKIHTSEASVDSSKHTAQLKAISQTRASAETTKEVQDSIRALELRLLAVRKSDYISNAAKKYTPADDEPPAVLDESSEWHPNTMTSIARDDLSRGFLQVDARGLRQASRRRTESGSGRSGGSILS